MGALAARLALTLAVGIACGLLFKKLKVPAGYMVGAFVGVAALNCATGLPWVPAHTRTAVQVVAGAFVGCSMERDDLRRLKSIGGPVAVMLSACLALMLLAGGLIYLPYLEGERSPVFDAQAQGVFFGMNTTHKREHFLRAVLEGTACGLSQILDVMRERQEIHDLRIIGGGAKSKLWKQILADVCNVTFHDVSTFSDSATSLGAAAAAGVAIGLFRDLPEACSHIRMSGDIEPDPAVQPVYALIKKRYAMLYPSLKEAFHTRA